jgi:site-specific DNA recombinase
VQARRAGNAVTRSDRPMAAEPSPLVGKLFDAAGERLTPSHAVKKGRRYRYYVSRALITGTRR